MLPVLDDAVQSSQRLSRSAKACLRGMCSLGFNADALSMRRLLRRAGQFGPYRCSPVCASTPSRPAQQPVIFQMMCAMRQRHAKAQQGPAAVHVCMHAPLNQSRGRRWRDHPGKHAKLVRSWVAAHLKPRMQVHMPKVRCSPCRRDRWVGAKQVRICMRLWMVLASCVSHVHTAAAAAV